MRISPQHALELCIICISHAEMPEHCLVPSPSSFVCVHVACACKFFMHACVKLHGCSVCMRVYVCLFVFYAAACVCVSIINGAALNSHHTHFYSPFLQLCVL